MNVLDNSHFNPIDFLAPESSFRNVFVTGILRFCWTFPQKLFMRGSLKSTRVWVEEISTQNIFENFLPIRSAYRTYLVSTYQSTMGDRQTLTQDYILYAIKSVSLNVRLCESLALPGSTVRKLLWITGYRSQSLRVQCFNNNCLYYYLISHILKWTEFQQILSVSYGEIWNSGSSLFLK